MYMSDYGPHLSSGVLHSGKFGGTKCSLHLNLNVLKPQRMLEEPLRVILKQITVFDPFQGVFPPYTQRSLARLWTPRNPGVSLSSKSKVTLGTKAHFR